MTHTLSRVLGAAALTVALATTGSAGAAEDRPVPTAPSTPTVRLAAPAEGAESGSPALTAAPRRIVSSVVRRQGRLYLRGDVEAYFGRRVVVQRKGCELCSWRRHDVTRTGKRGWFRSAIRTPKEGSAFWRARVAPSDGYARSFSAVWETYFS